MVGRAERLRRARSRARAAGCSSSSTSPTPRPDHEGLLGRHAPPARPRRQPGDPGPGAVPRRADHRARPEQPVRVGTVIRSPWPTGSRCCSPPSTSRRPTAGRPDRRGRPWAGHRQGHLGRASRAAVGGARLEVTLSVPPTRGLSSALQPLVAGKVLVSDDRRRLHATVSNGVGPGHRRGPGPRRRRHRWSTTSRSIPRRSTTCSSPSPAFRPRNPPNPSSTGASRSDRSTTIKQPTGGSGARSPTDLARMVVENATSPSSPAATLSISPGNR